MLQTWHHGMIQESTDSLILDDAPSWTICHEDGIASLRPRILRGRGILIGARISVGVHAIVVLYILLIPYFSTFQAGKTQSSITLSLVYPGEDIVEVQTQFNKNKGEKDIQNPPISTLQKVNLLKRHDFTGNKKRIADDITLRKRTGGNLKTVSAPSTPPVDQFLPQGDGNAIERGKEGVPKDEIKTIPKDQGNSGIAGGGTSSAKTFLASAEFSLKQADQPPIPTHTVEPEFPFAARRLGVGGRVVLRFLVKADGNVDKASVIEAEPKEIFEQSALEAIYKWKFTPGRYQGEAVAVWVVLPVKFKLSY